MRFLASKFAEEPKINMQGIVDVAIVEIKDSAMDVFALGQSRSAYSDQWSRRSLAARPMRRPRGGR